MKRIFLLIFLFSQSYFFSQEIIEKVIFANENNKVVLIFKEPIAHGIPGNSKNYFFAYDKKKPKKIGTLNAKKGAKPSNLFIVTTDGKMYSFKVEYKETLDFTDFTHQINKGFSLKEKKDENIKIITKKIDTSKPISTKDYDYHYKEENNTENSLLKISKKILLDNKRTLRSELRVKQKIFFSLKGYFYNKEELYFHLEIENKSKIDYDINYLTFFISHKKKKKRTLSQQVFLGVEGRPDYIYNQPKRVKVGEIKNVVAVFKKITLNKDKLLIIKLSELKGERELELQIPSKIINNPKNI